MYHIAFPPSINENLFHQNILVFKKTEGGQGTPSLKKKSLLKAKSYLKLKTRHNLSS